MQAVLQKDELKTLSEEYLAEPLSDTEYEEAKAQAKRKLARIIEREGDSNGERRKPYYLAQLIAEAVRAERFSAFTLELGELFRYAEEEHKRQIQQRKKEMPAAKAAGQI